MDNLGTGAARRRESVSDLAVAEIGVSGTVRTLNEEARSVWGWAEGDRLPNALRIGLSELDEGSVGTVAAAPGGASLMAHRFAGAGGWLLIGGPQTPAVRDNGSEFKSLIENIPVCVTLLGADGTVVFANEASRTLTGYEPGDLQGRRFWAEAVHSDDRWKWMGAQRRALEGEPARVVVRFLTKRSGPRLAEIHLHAATVEARSFVQCAAFDVTERSEVEEALFQSEALYRVFLEQSPVGMLHLDAAGTVTFENHQLRQIIGEDVEDAWIGRSIADVRGLDARARKLAIRMLDTGEPLRSTSACYHRHGLQYLQLHGSPIRHPEGGIVGGVLMVEDRTEEHRRKEELELRNRFAAAESELRKAALSDPNQQAFLADAARILGEAAGADRVHVLMNNAAGDCAAARARWWRAEVEEPETLVVLHREDARLEQLAKQRRGVHVHAPAADAASKDLLGKTGASEALWHPFFDESRLAGFVIVERSDVSSDGAPTSWMETERRLVEQLVRLFETLWSWMLAGSRYRKITGAIDDCLFTYAFDEDGERRYLFLTPQVETLTGRASNSLVEAGSVHWLQDVVYEEDQALVDRHDDLLREGSESRVTYRIRHHDGSTRWLQERATSETDGMGNVTVSGILTDVTEQKAAEEVLTEAKQHAESANRLKSAFIATMSHEIRTPMGAVNGFAELLTRELADLEEEGLDLPPQVIEFLQAIRENSKRLLTLVNDLFDLSNLEVGSIELRKATVPFHDVVMRTTSKVAVALSQKGVELHIDLAETDPLVLVDAQRLEQVLDNLLSNAVKFTDAGTVHVRTRTRHGRVIAEVEDTGVGMSESHLNDLFEPFVQEDSRLNRQFQGSGLGLSLARRLLDLMGGEIQVESQKGEGSLFRISLPEVRPDERRSPVAYQV